ncbi:hypothetical protein OG863_01100 [Streptomyces decoyicus]|uniref:Uncharacterized protein n=1 Tax=Streptomyces decoyicus TaxID=249567 RepID=A0ABZ1F900_9ACTN|nr:hypothetical protein [Streptomyces decoyicus]WSB66681.1 hypothetical protein OG863_01100 [Streptomyces decoyicus]
MAESGGGFDLREILVAKIRAEGIYVGTATSPNCRGLAEGRRREAEELSTSMRWMVRAAGQGTGSSSGMDEAAVCSQVIASGTRLCPAWPLSVW